MLKIILHFFPKLVKSPNFVFNFFGEILER